jgi:hypothetical protein
MKDAQFKALAHLIGTHVVSTRGAAVSLGYKPDVTVRDSSGVLKFILESEQKTDRKAYLGALLKAEMYAEQQKARPELIVVMQIFKNTSTKQIADHLRPYKIWLESKKGGALNLSAIHVLSDAEYVSAIAAVEIIGSAAFRLRGHAV